MIFKINLHDHCKSLLSAGAVREAIEALQRNNVKSFVLDLRNNRYLFFYNVIIPNYSWNKIIEIYSLTNEPEFFPPETHPSI